VSDCKIKTIDQLIKRQALLSINLLFHIRGVHGLDLGFFGSGLLLRRTGRGVRFSLLQPDPGWIWILFVFLKKRYKLFFFTFIKLESNRIRIACVSLVPDPGRIWIWNLQNMIGSELKRIRIRRPLFHMTVLINRRDTKSHCPIRKPIV